MFRIVSLIIFLNARNSLQNLIDCDQEVTKTQFCKLGDVYPEPLSIVQPTIHFFDVSEINEDKKTISVYFKLFLKWNDTYAKLKLANFDEFLKGEEGNWFDLTEDKQTSNTVLTYNQNVVQFINSQSVEYSFYEFWHREPHFKFYSEVIRETFYCDFDFQLFPFDKHKCYMRIYSTATSQQLKLTPTKIYVNVSTTNLTESPLLLQTNRLPYSITVESIPTSITFKGKLMYSTSGIVFNIRRNDIGQLIGGFYGPTAIFTLISLISLTS